VSIPSPNETQAQPRSSVLSAAGHDCAFEINRFSLFLLCISVISTRRKHLQAVRPILPGCDFRNSANHKVARVACHGVRVTVSQNHYQSLVHLSAKYFTVRFDKQIEKEAVSKVVWLIRPNYTYILSLVTKF
jgi:hypothetical protein